MLCLAPHFAADVLGPVIAACSYMYYYYCSFINKFIGLQFILPTGRSQRQAGVSNGLESAAGPAGLSQWRA